MHGCTSQRTVLAVRCCFAMGHVLVSVHLLANTGSASKSLCRFATSATPRTPRAFHRPSATLVAPVRGTTRPHRLGAMCPTVWKAGPHYDN